MNSPHLLDKYGKILKLRNGVFFMLKGVANKRYTPEFKKLIVEIMQQEQLSYHETCRRFDVNSRDRIKS